LSQFHGEYLLELVGEQELATKSGENKLIKTFKLVINGNSNESAELSTQDSSDGVSHNEGEEHGSIQDGGLSESFDLVGGSDRQDFVLSEDSVF
jgi:hypothetical protein